MKNINYTLHTVDMFTFYKIRITISDKKVNKTEGDYLSHYIRKTTTWERIGNQKYVQKWEIIYTDPGQGLFTSSCPLYSFQIKYLKVPSPVKSSKSRKKRSEH